MPNTSKSPNMRVSDDTKVDFDKVRERLVEQVGSGFPRHTHDLVVRSLLRIGGDHFDELVSAYRAEREAKIKEGEDEPTDDRPGVSDDTAR